MAQLELDEEFLKQYRELQQEWEKTLAELAKVLSKDPRLLSRYMNLSRRRVDSLRDQLTLLNLRQQELLVPVQQLRRAARSGCRPKARRTDQTVAGPRQGANGGRRGNGPQATLSRDLAEIAAGTITVQEDLGTWLPQKTKADDHWLPLREQAAKISTLGDVGRDGRRQSETPKRPRRPPGKSTRWPSIEILGSRAGETGQH